MRRSLRMQVGLTILLAFSCLAHSQTEPAPAATPLTRAVGTIKSTQAGSLILSPDSGGEVAATLNSSTKILRVPPGEKDLKNATALQAQDLQSGDRVLVRGLASADGKSIAALAVIVMKQGDVSAKQEHDREDWQKRGVGGLVTALDSPSGTVTISSAALGGNRNITVHTTRATTTRRYAPDSVKFDDARPSTVDQIRVGDQLRARGSRNADGSELTAEDIVFGSFRNIAGTITAIDPASNSITVHDLAAKSSVTVKLTPDSQIRKLPPEMAQRIAQRLKGGASENNGQATGQPPAAAPSNTASSTPSSAGNAGQWQRGNASAPPDLQRFLGRLPASALSDLQKGDAVMIVATQGGDVGAVTAITLLGGVEPILTAAPSRDAFTLSPWTLGGGQGDSAP